MTKILDKINSPKDLKSLSIEELNSLAEEMREVIIKKVNTTGGHMGPNLGFVEPTIALHYVFSSPVDKFVFDVSHQCYPHKILTGRKEGFTNPEKYYDYSGFTAPTESEHDVFTIGHTSTAVSLATGLAKGRDLQKGKENIIAIIGDGSMSGGEAFEGFNNSAVLGTNFIIVVNDNEMSIAENQGGLYKNLKLLRETKGKAECNIFKALGFEYKYVPDGNDIKDLIETFKNVKDTDHPTVVHIHTLKGKGLKVAEENKEAFHWILPGTLDKKTDSTPQKVENYNSITNDFIISKKNDGIPIVAITAATPGATCFSQEFRNELKEHYTDVGIAEEHAIAYCSGIAKRGGRPIFSVLSSFIQRTYDQMIQDLALNNSPATVLVNWGGISPADATHSGMYDIPLISNIPNIVYLAPTCKEEYLKMLEFATSQNLRPVFIRVPFGNFISTGIEDKTDYSILNKSKVVNEGETVAVLAVGSFFEKGKQVIKELEEKTRIKATLINPTYLTGLDNDLLEALKQNHKLIVTLEDGVLNGGYGEKIASFYGNSNQKVLNFGAKKEFTDRIPLDKLYEKYHLTTKQIVEDIQKTLN